MFGVESTGVFLGGKKDVGLDRVKCPPLLCIAFSDVCLQPARREPRLDLLFVVALREKFQLLNRCVCWPCGWSARGLTFIFKWPVTGLMVTLSVLNLSSTMISLFRSRGLPTIFLMTVSFLVPPDLLFS